MCFLVDELKKMIIRCTLSYRFEIPVKYETKKAAHRAAFLFRVPRTGIEPAHPCEYQILSLARLPIPPSGQINLLYEECPLVT